MELWKEQEATDEDLKKRKKALEQFIKKISIEKETPKNRKQNKSAKPPLFNKGDCFIFKMSNGRYGGAVVLDEVYKGMTNYNYIARTKINMEDKPNIDDFINAEIIVIPFQNGEEVEDIRTYFPSELKGGLSLIEVVGNLSIRFRRNVGGTWGSCNYKEFVSFAESCLSHFQMGNETKTKAFVSQYIKNC